jgi:hypothetical protein
MRPLTEAIAAATKAEQAALDLVRPEVQRMANELVAGRPRETINQAMRETLQPVVQAMEGALTAERQALTAMQSAVTMQQALGAMPPIVTAMQGIVEAQTQALTAMKAAQPQSTVKDIQGLPAADGQQRDVIPGDGGLRDTDGVLRAADSGTGGEFFNQLTGVPITYLISTPLVAAARSNLALASVMTEFIDQIGYTKEGKTRLISFDLTRPVKNNLTGKLDTQTIEVKAPLLAVVPLPALLIDTVNVDLTVEISQKTQQKTNVDTTLTVKVSPVFGWLNTEFSGSYTNKQENTRETNQSAKYEIRLLARQQPLPEGMSKLMDVFASTIEPLETPARR